MDKEAAFGVASDVEPTESAESSDKHDYFYCRSGWNDEYGLTFLQMHLIALKKAGRKVLDTKRRGDIYQIKVMKLEN